MSDEEESMGEHAVDALYDLGYGAGALMTGEVDEAADRFLTASGEALDAVTDGGFSHLVDRVEGDTGLDLGQMAHDGVQAAGEFLGDTAWAATEAVEGAYDTVSDVAGEVYDTVSDTASDAYDAVSDTAGEAYDTVAGWFE